MYEDFEDEEMDMPTPCANCNEIFDLNDGYGSEKWYPNITICEKCHEDEEAEIEEDERWETINDEIGEALYGMDKDEDFIKRISSENKELILKLASLLKVEDL